MFGDPTLAEAILDRVVHNAYRIELAGESLRKRRSQSRGPTLAPRPGRPTGGASKAVDKAGYAKALWRACYARLAHRRPTAPHRPRAASKIRPA